MGEDGGPPAIGNPRALVDVAGAEDDQVRCGLELGLQCLESLREVVMEDPQADHRGGLGGVEDDDEPPRAKPFELLDEVLDVEPGRSRVGSLAVDVEERAVLVRCAMEGQEQDGGATCGSAELLEDLSGACERDGVRVELLEPPVIARRGEILESEEPVHAVGVVRQGEIPLVARAGEGQRDRTDRTEPEHNPDEKAAKECRGHGREDDAGGPGPSWGDRSTADPPSPAASPAMSAVAAPGLEVNAWVSTNSRAGPTGRSPCS